MCKYCVLQRCYFTSYFREFLSNACSGSSLRRSSLCSHSTCLSTNPLVVVGPEHQFKHFVIASFFQGMIMLSIMAIFSTQSREIVIIPFGLNCFSTFLISGKAPENLHLRELIFYWNRCKLVPRLFPIESFILNSEAAHFTQAQSWRGPGPSPSSRNPS